MSIRSLLLAFLFLPAVTAIAGERNLAFSDGAIPREGALVLGVISGGEATAAQQAVDRITEGAISATLAEQAIKAGKTRVLYGPGPFQKVILVGMQDSDNRRLMLENLGGHAAQVAAKDKAGNIVLAWDDGAATATDAAHLAFGAALGQYRFDRYKSQDEADDSSLGTLTVNVPGARGAEALFNSRWKPVAEAVRLTRDLIAEPANIIYPQSFVDRTRTAFEGVDNVTIRVLDEKEIQAMGMGALAGVGQGSARPPRLLAVHYQGGPEDQRPLAFVGKGITFDTGGISLKDGNGVWKMKFDMSGAAAAIGSVLALAKRGAAVNVVGIAALAENMPSATAQRPGDVVRTASGKTIEIISTDAEGRLVLADGVWFAQQEYRPAILVDLATLTGSVSVALGDEYAGAFSRDAEWVTGLIAAGEASGEHLWHLPLHDSYAEDIKSDIADIKNISGHRLAGAGVGAQVIGTFVVEDQPWVHLDIAGMAWRDKDAATVPKGAVGFGVRLLDTWADEFVQ